VTVDKEQKVILGYFDDTSFMREGLTVMANYRNYLLFLIMSVFLNGTIFSMTPPLKPLKFVEREIFLYELNRLGKKSMVKILAQEQDAFRLEIPLTFYFKVPGDVLTKIIFEAIALKEDADEERGQTGKMVDNRLGDYTEYTYETEKDNFSHIKCTTTFTNREVLAEELVSLITEGELQTLLEQIQLEEAFEQT